MLQHLTPKHFLLLSLDTIKVDILGIQDFTRVDAESNTIDLGGTLFGSRLVFDSDLGFTLCKHRVVDMAFVVLSLYLIST
jgi:hypothetical protein